MTFTEGAFDGIVDRFYEAAALPDLWPDVLHQTALATGCEGGSIITFPSPGMMPHSEGVGELIDTFIRGGWQAHNTRAQRGAALLAQNPAVGLSITTDHDLISPDEIKRDPFFQDFLAPLGFGQHFSGPLAQGDGQFVFISFERKSSSGLYSQREIETLNRLFGRLRTAGSLALRIGLSAAGQTIDVLDRIGCAAALFDGSGRLWRANSQFERILGDGLHIRHGRLMAVDREASASLGRLVAAATGGSNAAAALGQVPVPRLGGRLPLIVEAVPVAGAANDIFGLARAVLMISDPEDRVITDPDLLRRAFRLTPTEARLAVLLASGEGLDWAADILAITRSTARVHLKSLFAKTGTHRQAELVSLLASLHKKRRI